MAYTRPLNFLLTGYGSQGDMVPLLFVGGQLKEMGHNVVVAANPYFKPEIEKCGFSFIPVGTTDEYIRSQSDPRTWDAKTAEKMAQQELDRQQYQFAAAISGYMATPLPGGYSPRPFDAIVHSPLTVAAPTLADDWCIPHFPLILSDQSYWFSGEKFPRHDDSKPVAIIRGLPTVARKALMPLIGFARTHEHRRLINGLRDKKHVPPIGSFYRDHWLKGHHVLLFPEWFGPAQEHGWPASFRHFGFPMMQTPTAEAENRFLSLFLGSQKLSPVLWTEGSTNMSVDHAELAIKVSERLGRGVILVGPNYPEKGAWGSNSELGDLFKIRQVPLFGILKRCAACVCHAGIGTASAAIQAEVPMVTLPAMGDQFHNSERLCQLRMAVEVPRGNRNPEKIATAVEDVIRSPDAKGALSIYSGHLRNPPGALSAGEWIVEMARGGHRILERLHT
jgi:rhamnosyltransferase subunit B